jgi:hypothetical protein
MEHLTTAKGTLNQMAQFASGPKKKLEKRFSAVNSLQIFFNRVIQFASAQ